MAGLTLPDGNRTRVWRLIRDRIKNDNALQTANVTLLFFEGDRDATTSPDNLVPPSVIFFAGLGPMRWFDERAMSGKLIVSYTAVLGIDNEDMLNLQEAIEEAIYPNDSFVFHQSLVNAGAITGQPEFSQPATTTLTMAGQKGLIKSTGQFVIEVERGFAP